MRIEVYTYKVDPTGWTFKAGPITFSKFGPEYRKKNQDMEFAIMFDDTLWRM